MEKPPRGKHSTKGLGKKVPAEAGFAKWKDEVVVPCGKPVDSKVKSSELMYNEYIVYDTAQVSLLHYCMSFKFHVSSIVDLYLKTGPDRWAMSWRPIINHQQLTSC